MSSDLLLRRKRKRRGENGRTQAIRKGNEPNEDEEEKRRFENPEIERIHTSKKNLHGMRQKDGNETRKRKLEDPNLLDDLLCAEKRCIQRIKRLQRRNAIWLHKNLGKRRGLPCHEGRLPTRSQPSILMLVELLQRKTTVLHDLPLQKIRHLTRPHRRSLPRTSNLMSVVLTQRLNTPRHPISRPCRLRQRTLGKRRDPSPHLIAAIL